MRSREGPRDEPSPEQGDDRPKRATVRKRRTGGGRSDPGGAPAADHAGAGTPEPVDAWAAWIDRWERPEEERVAQWLRTKVQPGVEVPHSDQPDSEAFEERREPYPRPRSPDPEVALLDDQRRRLAAALDAQRSEFERARQEQLEARRRLDAEVARLDQERQQVAAAVEARREEARRLEAQRAEAAAALASEVSGLDAEHERVAAAIEAERREAERVRQEAERVRQEKLAAKARLEAELAALDAERRQLAEALEAERAEAERLRRQQEEERAQLEAEVVALRTDTEESNRRWATDSYTAATANGGPEPPPPTPAVQAQLDNRSKLALAVAELGRELAAAREAERREATRTATGFDGGTFTAAPPAAPVDEAAEQRPRSPAPARTRPLVPAGSVWRFAALVAALAFVGLVAFEVGSPIVAQSDLDDTARRAAAGAAAEYRTGKDLQRARLAAEWIAHDEGSVLTGFSLVNGGLRVVVEREAESLVLKHVGATEKWYDLDATAVARP